MCPTETRFRVNATDPTESLTLRRSFESAFNSRLRDVRGEAREIVPQHVEGAPSDVRTLRRIRNWLTVAAEQTLLEPVSPRAAAQGDHWTGSYVRQAYDAGLRLAYRDMRDLGASQSVASDATSADREAHHDHRAREMLSAYYGTEDAADTIRGAASDAVYDGVVQEDSKTAFTERVTASLTAEAENQTAAHAQTVVVETVNEALLTAFEIAGVSEVGVAVEHEPGEPVENGMRLNAAGELQWITAGDARVCPDCQALAGTTVRIDDVRERPDFRPPLHPRCRCRMVPTAMETGGEPVSARQGDREQVTEGEGRFAREQEVQ